MGRKGVSTGRTNSPNPGFVRYRHLWDKLCVLGSRITLARVRGSSIVGPIEREYREVLDCIREVQRTGAVHVPVPEVRVEVRLQAEGPQVRSLPALQEDVHGEGTHRDKVPG